MSNISDINTQLISALGGITTVGGYHYNVQLATTDIDYHFKKTTKSPWIVLSLAMISSKDLFSQYSEIRSDWAATGYVQSASSAIEAARKLADDIKNRLYNIFISTRFNGKVTDLAITTIGFADHIHAETNWGICNLQFTITHHEPLGGA
jgi:hypothetical protein